MIFVNATDLLGPDWRFLELYCKGRDIAWEFHSGVASNKLERLVRRPNIGRYRAALTAARSAGTRSDAVLVSHMPRMSAATNIAARMFAPRVPHIAFSFTFTDLPEGPDLRVMRAALEGVREFVVFSNYERALYAEYFDLPLARMRHLNWAMDAPAPGPHNPAADLRPYVCAAGGEGRDYGVLAEAMRAHPTVRAVVIARPHNVAAVDFPKNVMVLTNRPVGEYWRIIADSAALVLPLRSAHTFCARLTMIAGQLLGVPIVMTRPVWIEDYAPSEDLARFVPPGEPEALAAAIGSIFDDPSGARAMADRAQAYARANSAPDRWVDYFLDLRNRLVATGASGRSKARRCAGRNAFQERRL